MKTLRERDQVREVAAKWRLQYPPEHRATREEFKVKGRQLSELIDPETSTAADVASIIGNQSWVAQQRCHECNEYTWDVVQLGEEPDYESNTANVCAACLRKALALLEPA